MKCTVTVFCDDKLASGFILAGVNVVTVTSAEQACPALLKALADRRWGLVVVSQEIMSTLPDEVQSKLRESAMPLFVDLPLSVTTLNEDYATRARRYVSDLIQNVIGKKITVTG